MWWVEGWEAWESIGFVRSAQDFCDSILRYGTLMKAAPDFQFIPKVHLAFHLVHQMAFLGNAKTYATWVDEAFNKNLKASCRNASQLNWEPTVLTRMMFSP